MKHIYKRKIASGFTLVETLVALSIIMIGLMGAFSVAQIGISSTSKVKDRITAYFLAQEAFEAVKRRRDHNLLLIAAGNTNVHWLDGLTRISGSLGGPCYPPNFRCGYDVYTSLRTGEDVFFKCQETNPVPGPYLCRLQNISQDLNNPTNPIGPQFYGGYYAGATETKFNREIYVTEISSGEVLALVKVTVFWTGGLFETSNYIFNWF